MKLIVTVDVEADNQWLEEPIATIENVFALPRFHDLAKKYQFKPSYLLTYEVASDPRAVALFRLWRDKGEAEIGAHLHPWTTPPIGQPDSFKRFPSELSDDELREKFANLTRVIEKNFGRPPRSYRAGRFGLDGRQISLLREFGYVADCSVTPKVSWDKPKLDRPGENGPDWRGAPVGPYFPSEDNPAFPADQRNGILELPMTILATGFAAREGRLNRFLLKLPGDIFSRVIRKLFYRMKWLRVFPETTADDWPALYRAAVINNLPVIEFMIHSSELSAGMSPYAKTEAAVEKIYRNLESLFEFLKSKAVSGATLSEAAESEI
jgi:hypothetical protein